MPLTMSETPSTGTSGNGPGLARSSSWNWNGRSMPSSARQPRFESYDGRHVGISSIDSHTNCSIVWLTTSSSSWAVSTSGVRQDWLGTESMDDSRAQRTPVATQRVAADESGRSADTLLEKPRIAGSATVAIRAPIDREVE